MHTKHLRQLMLAAATLLFSSVHAQQLFFYCAGEHEGFHVAASVDNVEFKELGQLFSSDYSAWGSGKVMFNPYMIHYGKEGAAVVFQLMDKAANVAITCSEDLITWRPQDYPLLSTRSCVEPRIKASDDGRYEIVYKTRDHATRHFFADASLRHFTNDESIDNKVYDAIACAWDSVVIDGKMRRGQRWDVTEEKMKLMTQHFDKQRMMHEKAGETLKHDGKRFAGLPATVDATLHVDTLSQHDISDMLIGVFFEDISYAADGGLYAEMVQNRDFEYNQSDKREWNATTAWHSDADIIIDTIKPLSKANPHYAVITDKSIANEGWDGMRIKKGGQYDFSIFVRGKKTLSVNLEDAKGVCVASCKIKARGKEWKRYSASMMAMANADSAHLVIKPEGKEVAYIDMVSLFPHDTYKGHANGLRRDLAETIADIHPRFVRFPGGCMSHGQGLDNIYHWQHSVGPLQDRLPDTNVWHYHQTRGMGFYELFQWCEDMGAEPLPVLAAGVCCQNSGINAKGHGGQQGGIAMADMPAYIDELCNLIEWANGDPATNKWARMRAEAGHPLSFNLKYIGIGNEDLVSTVFEERCKMICEAIKQRYPDIIICGTAGPFHSPSSDYVEGWRFANANRGIIDMLDEHYYESVGWFLNNRNYYDNYDRKGAKVYLGEYAARDGNGTLDAALAEAAYLTAVERNGDVVAMTSYAPLLSKDKHSNWRPDLIYFSNDTIRLSPSYHTQRLFGLYSGNRYISSNLSIDSTADNRVAASVVMDTKTGDMYLKIVNILPSSLRINLTGLSLPRVLQAEGYEGKPGDSSITTHQYSYTDGNIILPPYSFRVIRINSK